MIWFSLFLCVCLIFQSLHFSLRLDKIEKSYKNWAQGIADECNASLGRYYAAYKSDVTEWIKDFIDRYVYSHDAEFPIDDNKNNVSEDEKD